MMSQRILGLVCVASLASVSWASTADSEAGAQAEAELGIQVMSQSDYAMTYTTKREPTVVTSRRRGLSLNGSKAISQPDQMKKYRQYGKPVGMILVPNPAAKPPRKGMASPCAAVPDGIKQIKDTVLSPCQDFDQKQPGAPVSMSAGIKFYCAEGGEGFGIDKPEGTEQLENIAEIYGLTDGGGDKAAAAGGEAKAATAAFIEIGAALARFPGGRKRAGKKELCEKLFKSASGGAYSGWKMTDGKGEYVKANAGEPGSDEKKEAAPEEKKASFRSVTHTRAAKKQQGNKGRDHYFDDLFFDLDTQ